MTKEEIRNLVHNIINFSNDEIGRTLASSMTPAWSTKHNADILTNEQAQALLAEITVAVREAAFTVLSKN